MSIRPITYGRLCSAAEKPGGLHDWSRNISEGSLAKPDMLSENFTIIAILHWQLACFRTMQQGGSAMHRGRISSGRSLHAGQEGGRSGRSGQSISPHKFQRARQSPKWMGGVRMPVRQAHVRSQWSRQTRTRIRTDSTIIGVLGERTPGRDGTKRGSNQTISSWKWF